MTPLACGELRARLRALPSADDIAGLIRKYQEILRLRRAAALVPEADPRRAMAALAAEFPGALREADDLPIDDLERRVRALARAEVDPAAVEGWMTTTARFHALTRGALCAKRWLAGRKQVDDGVRRAFEADTGGLCYATDARAWIADLDRLADPPRGRVTDVVFERMSTELGLGVDELRRTVFGSGRLHR